MTQPETGMRPFSVRARHEDPHHARVVSETSFEAAAIAFVEHLALPDDVSGGISVIVHDLETGHEHSFHVPLDHGAPTGTA